MEARTFLHVDMDAFFAAVEQRDRPELRGKPVMVGAPPDQRGVVAAASYEAREFGVHSAMPSREAASLCPQGIFLQVNGKRYREISRQVFAIFERFTPFVEGLSVDEAFLDVTGARRLFGEGPRIARTLKTTIKDETGLTASVGVAPNKFLAKLASDMDKPDGLTVVPSSREEIVAFLAPLPVGRIWGVGKVTRERLEKVGIRFVGDLQSTTEQALSATLGKHSARHLIRLAMGEDEREIDLEHEEKSMSHEHTFSRDCTSAEKIKEVLDNLVDDVGGRLRKAEKFAGIAHLKLRWKGFQTITRQRPFENPCCDDFTMRQVANTMLGAENIDKPVRLIGFGVSRLTDRSQEQLSLFGLAGPSSARREQLSRTVDAIRREHGQGSIGRGSSQRHRDEVD
jgi:DNA polymerase-4